MQKGYSVYQRMKMVLLDAMRIQYEEDFAEPPSNLQLAKVGREDFQRAMSGIREGDGDQSRAKVWLEGLALPIPHTHHDIKALLIVLGVLRKDSPPKDVEMQHAWYWTTMAMQAAQIFRGYGIPMPDAKEAFGPRFGVTTHEPDFKHLAAALYRHNYTTRVKQKDGVKVRYLVVSVRGQNAFGIPLGELPNTEEKFNACSKFDTFTPDYEELARYLYMKGTERQRNVTGVMPVA